MPKMTNIKTYEDLKNYLCKLSKKQLKQNIQVTDPHSGNVTPITDMLPGIAIGTMEEMEFYAARSVTDNKFNPEEIVILTDYNGHGEDGAIAYEGFRGKPIYGKNGKTSPKDQLNPKYRTSKDVDGLRSHIISSLKSRVNKMKVFSNKGNKNANGDKKTD